MAKETPHPSAAKASMSLAEFLQNTRETAGLSLRDVEEKSKGEISNAYLSQLEHGRVKRPSPNILHTLAEVYQTPYEVLMEKAGYVVASPHGRRVATFASQELTPEEEGKLLEYLAFLRTRKGST